MLYQQRDMAMQGLAFPQGQRPPNAEALAHWGQPPPEQQHEQAAAAQQHPEVRPLFELSSLECRSYGEVSVVPKTCLQSNWLGKLFRALHTSVKMGVWA